MGLGSLDFKPVPAVFAVFLLLCSLGFSQNTPDPQSQFLNLVVPQGQSNMTVQLPSVPSIPNINVQVPAPPSMPQEQPESQEPQLKVVKKTVYVGQDSVFSGLDELSKYGTEGLDIVKTSAGYIYKSRYSQDKWVEVGSDAKGSYVSLIKVVEKEAIEQPPSIDSIPPMPAQPQQPAWQDKAVLPNVMPSLAFDSSDAAVVQRELDYLSKRFVFVPQESQAKEYVEQAFGIPSPPPLNQQPATQGKQAASSEKTEQGSQSMPPLPPSNVQRQGSTIQILDIKPEQLPSDILEIPINTASAKEEMQGSPLDAITQALSGSQSAGSNGASPASQGLSGSNLVWLIAAATFVIAIISAAAFGILQLTNSLRPFEIDPLEYHRIMSNETRLEILTELSGADRIPTDLSSKLNKSKSTISEHLDKLVAAGFVEKREEDGKKFVYYKLTSKGKSALRRTS